MEISREEGRGEGTSGVFITQIQSVYHIIGKKCVLHLKPRSLDHLSWHVPQWLQPVQLTER